MVKKLLLILLIVSLVVTPVSADWSDWLKNPLAVAPCGGFKLISATPIYISSTNENLSGKSTTLYGAAICSGDFVSLISRNELSSMLNLPIGTDIELGIVSTEEVNTYPILNEGIPVYTYTYVRKSSTQSWPSGIPAYQWHVSCTEDEGLYRTRVGTLGSIGAPSSRASALFTVKVGEKTSQIKVSSTSPAEDLTTPDGEAIGSVTWLGSLVTGTALPSESNYAAIYDEVKKTWRLTTDAEKLSYVSKQAATEASIATVPPGQTWVGGSSSSGYSSYCNGPIYAPSGAVAAAGLSSSAAGTMLGSSAQLGAAPIHNSSDIDKAAVPFAVMSKINNPTLLIRIRADLLNIILSVGKPLITSVSPLKFGAGEFGFLKVTAQNAGDAQGSFTAEATCGSLSFAPSQAVTLLPGKSWEFSLQTNAIKEEKGSCTVKVCEMGSNECATTSAGFEVTPTKKCIPGEVKPELMQITPTEGGFGSIETLGGLVLTQCSLDGMSTIVIKSCAVGTLVYEPSAKPYPWACTEVATCGKPVEIYSKYLSESLKANCTPTFRTVSGVTEKYIGATGASVAGQNFIEAAWTSTEPVKVESTACYDLTAKPESWSFVDATSGCTYLCQAVYGSGTMNEPTTFRNNLLGCDASTVTKYSTQVKSTGVVAPPAIKTSPPLRNQTGASTAGMCKVDNDCLYVGEKCVTGTCQKSEGFAGLPGFEAVFAVLGLLVVAIRIRHKRS